MNSLHTTNGDDCGCTSWIYASGAVGALCVVAAVVIIVLLVYIRRLQRRSHHSTARVSKGQVATAHQQATIDAGKKSWDATASRPTTMNNRCNTNTAKPKATKNGFDSLGYSVAEQARHDYLVLQNRDNNSNSNSSNNNNKNENTADDGYLRPQCVTVP